MPTNLLHRLVITGAPCSGKSEAVLLLQSLPQFAGHLFFHELARQLLTEQPELRGQWTRFHLELYRLQTARETTAGTRPFVTDRGTVDAFAFHPETVKLVASSIPNEYTRYTAVLQLGSAASLGGSAYQQDAIRLETPAEALEIERALRSVWSGHPCYRFIEAQPAFADKLHRLFETIDELLSSTTGNSSLA